jgi:hypothetical protein
MAAAWERIKCVDAGTRRLAALAAAGLLLCVGCAERHVPDTELAEIFLRSALPGQIQSISEIARGALEHHRARLSATQFAVAEQIVLERFAPESLERNVREHLRAQPRSKFLGQALTELRTPLCERVVLARVAFHEPSIQQEAQKFFEQSEKTPPTPARLELIERYDVAANSADVAAHTVLLATLGSAVILNALQPPDERLDRGELLDNVASSRKLLLPIFEKTSAMTSLLVFKNLSDEELESYVVFSESKSGEWYHRTTSSALLDSLREISLGIGNVYLAALNAQSSS